MRERKRERERKRNNDSPLMMTPTLAVVMAPSLLASPRNCATRMETAMLMPSGTMNIMFSTWHMMPWALSWAVLRAPVKER
jgi:hypothetical protein